MQAAMPAMVATGNNSDGLGMGGGLIGGLMLGALMRNGGFGGEFGNGNYGNHRGGNWGGGHGEGCVTPTNLTAGLTGVTDAIQNTEVMAALGDIKASVPLAEAQVQLALAGATGEIRSHIGATENALIQGQFGIQQHITSSSTANAVAHSQIRESILATSSQNLQAVLENRYVLAKQIAEDGARTRDLITTNQIAELNRIAAERQDEIIELRNRNDRDRDRHGIEITMTNNQNQNQLQMQQQQQLINSMHGRLCDVDQIARATNQQLIIGNTGTTTGGAQSSNPTNVKA